MSHLKLVVDNTKKTSVFKQIVIYIILLLILASFSVILTTIL